MVEAYNIILHKGVDGQTYNIGSQVERSVLSVAHDVLRLMRLPADMVKHVRDRAFNDRRYFVCDKKLTKLGMRPLLTPSDVRGDCTARMPTQHFTACASPSVR